MVAPQRPSRVRPAGTYSRRGHVLGHRPGHSWVPGSRSWVAVYRPASAGCEASQKKAGIKSNDAPSLGGTGTGEVDPAGQPALADGSAIAPSSRAVEVPVQVPLNDEAANGTNDEQDELRTDAHAVRLLLVLTGSSTPARLQVAPRPPAASREETLYRISNTQQALELLHD